MKKVSINQKLNIINKIQKIRSKNNINWMNILKIALINAPEKTTRVIKKINNHDKEISKLVKKI